MKDDSSLEERVNKLMNVVLGLIDEVEDQRREIELFRKVSKSIYEHHARRIREQDLTQGMDKG